MACAGRSSSEAVPGARESVRARIRIGFEAPGHFLEHTADPPGGVDGMVEHCRTNEMLPLVPNAIRGSSAGLPAGHLRPPGERPHCHC